MAWAGRATPSLPNKAGGKAAQPDPAGEGSNPPWGERADPVIRAYIAGAGVRLPTRRTGPERTGNSGCGGGGGVVGVSASCPGRGWGGGGTFCAAHGRK